MAKKTLIQPEQIEAARKILQQLPVKETAKTKQEAATALSKDFQGVFKKGYSPTDICEVLKKEGISIPSSLIKAQMREARRGGRPGKDDLR